MVIGPVAKLEIWPMDLDETIVTAITVIGADSRAEETLRVTALGGAAQNAVK